MSLQMEFRRGSYLRCDLGGDEIIYTYICTWKIIQSTVLIDLPLKRATSIIQTSSLHAFDEICSTRDSYLLYIP